MPTTLCRTGDLRTTNHCSRMHNAETTSRRASARAPEAPFAVGPAGAASALQAPAPCRTWCASARGRSGLNVRAGGVLRPTAVLRDRPDADRGRHRRPALTDAGDAGDLWRGLGDHFSEFVSFAVGLLVIGFYWTSNHAALRPPAGRGSPLCPVDRAVPRRRRVPALSDPPRRDLRRTTRSRGRCSRSTSHWSAAWRRSCSPSSWRADLLAVRLSRPDCRWLALMSLSPVPLFLLSIPVAWVEPAGDAGGVGAVALRAGDRRTVAGPADLNG